MDEWRKLAVTVLFLGMLAVIYRALAASVFAAHGYFGTADEDSEVGILRPASVYSPKKRIVAIASKETGTHIPFSCANCIVR